LELTEEGILPFISLVTNIWRFDVFSDILETIPKFPSIPKCPRTHQIAGYWLPNWMIEGKFQNLYLTCETFNFLCHICQKIFDGLKTQKLGTTSLEQYVWSKKN
jgi:hypothetical protein